MNERPPDDRRKRPATILGQALNAADALVSEVQQRIPPELLNQLRAGQRQIDQRISKLQSQLGRSATRAEVDRLSRRIDELAARLEQLTRGGTRPSRPGQTDRPGRGGQRSNAASSGGPRRSSASSTASDKPPRRSPRASTKREQGDAPKPRRSPRTRSRKPPESPAG